MSDLISRQAAIKAIGNLYPDMPKIDFLDNRSLWRQKYEQYINAQQTIRDLPSVPVNYGSTNHIDRQAAIEAILQRLDALKGLVLGTSTFREGIADGYARIMSDLKHLPSAQQWIPVSERLPEDDGWYLVTDDSGGVRWLEVEHYDTEFGLKPFCTVQNPVAWMPLPEPWKGGQDAEIH